MRNDSRTRVAKMILIWNRGQMALPISREFPVTRPYASPPAKEIIRRNWTRGGDSRAPSRYAQEPGRRGELPSAVPQAGAVTTPPHQPPPLISALEIAKPISTSRRIASEREGSGSGCPTLHESIRAASSGRNDELNCTPFPIGGRPILFPITFSGID